MKKPNFLIYAEYAKENFKKKNRSGFTEAGIEVAVMLLFLYYWYDYTQRTGFLWNCLYYGFEILVAIFLTNSALEVTMSLYLILGKKGDTNIKSIKNDRIQERYDYSEYKTLLNHGMVVIIFMMSYINIHTKDGIISFNGMQYLVVLYYYLMEYLNFFHGKSRIQFVKWCERNNYGNEETIAAWEKKYFFMAWFGKIFADSLYTNKKS